MSVWPASQLAWTLASQARETGSKPVQVTKSLGIEQTVSLLSPECQQKRP